MGGRGLEEVLWEGEEEEAGWGRGGVGMVSFLFWIFRSFIVVRRREAEE